MPSVEVRILIIFILLAIVIARRYGVFKALQEGRVRKRKEKEELLQKEERQERREKAKKRRALKKKQTSETLRRSVTGLEHHSLEVGNQKFWYLEEGSGPTRPRILLLHGVPGDKESWGALALYLLDEGYHVLVPDLPGFGQNTRDPHYSYDVPTQAKRIHALMQAIDFKQFHIVGCGWGATIAAAYAYAFADEVLSLSLLEPFGVRAPYESELEKRLAQNQNPLVVSQQQEYEEMLRFLLHDVTKTPKILARIRVERAVERRDFHAKVWQELRQKDRVHLLDMLLPEIQHKTLVILGKDSRLIHSSTGDLIRDLLPRAYVTVIEQCGHWPMVEQPQETATWILEFVKSAEGQG